MAIELSGRLAASLARRWAYSRAVIPGVTGERLERVLSALQCQANLRQLSTNVDESHAMVARIATLQQIPRHTCGVVRSDLFVGKKLF